MKLGIRNEKETWLCAAMLFIAYVVSAIFPERAPDIQATTMWVFGLTGVLTTEKE
jgi:hypothetical protein